MDYAEILPQIVELAKRVGAFQKDNLRKTNLLINTKSTKIDLVTEIDKVSDQMIATYIKTHFPSHALLSEESGKSDKQSDYLWVVDPLDGTTNFSQGLPIFAVSIALQYKGDTMLGVVYNSVTDDLFTAIKGKGAYRNGNKMAVSQKDNLISSVLATGFPYDVAEHPVNNINYFNALLTKTRAIRRFGAAAYDIALVADGRFDGYWEMNLSKWDVTAALLMVEEAGGKVIHFREDRGISIVVGNEKICRLILEELKKVQTA